MNFTYNGISSETMNLKIIKFSPPAKAEQIVDEITIPGKAVSTMNPLKNYSRTEVKATFAIVERTQYRNIMQWLSGTGKLIFSDEPNKCYNAHFFGEIQSERIFDDIFEFEVKVSFDPFAYSVSSTPVDISTATTYTAVTNNGTIYSEPVIKFKLNSGSSVLMGDVNFDGVVNAIDAQLVLEEYTSVQSGAGSILTDAQKAVADVNGDGVVDILDANEILEIYANSQGSSGTQTMSDVYISVNGETLKISVPEAVVNSGYEVTIDSSLQLIYYTNYDGDKINIMQYSYGDLPLLHIGTNYIKYIGDINSMTITVNERWL